MKSKNRYIGITMGDPSGIGPEIIAKAMSRPSIRKLANYKIIGDYSVYRKYSTVQNERGLSFIDLKNIPLKNVNIRAVNRLSGKAALNYLQKAVELLKNNKISALVTAPVCKEAVCLTEPSFQGHTEFLADAFKIKNVGMLFVANKLRVIIVTRHIPVCQISKKITPQLVYETISLTSQALKKNFKIKRPRIAVCGLNPHAGEGGNIGKEEIAIILPAINRAKKNKIATYGPFAADTLFSGAIENQYDAIVAMYHDQGLIPVKTRCFTKLVNLTVGLPVIRTSPAHGTAFNIAGKNKADPSSMCEAIKLAAELSQ